MDGLPAETNIQNPSIQTSNENESSEVYATQKWPCVASTCLT